MPLPVAAKGVIIVGGIVVAVGVALYEHEPFRIWFDENWEKAGAAWQDFSQYLTPEGRQRRREGPYGGGPAFANSSGPARRGQGDAAAVRRGDADTERARMGREYLRRRQRFVEERRDSGVGSVGGNSTREAHEMDKMPDRALRAEAILKEADRTNGSANPFADRNPLAYHPINNAPTDDAETAIKFEADSDEPGTPTSTIPTALTPVTPRTPAAHASDGDDVSEASLDIFSSVHTPGTETDSLNDPLDDMRSDAGTETMSHVSIDPETGEEREVHSVSDRDDVMSVASSWSQVSSVGPEH